jgi:hypothetical protein
VVSEAIHSKGVTNAPIRRPHILKRLRTRICATFSTDPLIPKDLRERIGPILINADSKRLKRQLRAESGEARGNWKSEVRNRKRGMRRRECGQARRGGQAMARLGAATMSRALPVAEEAGPPRPARWRVWRAGPPRRASPGTTRQSAA